MNTPFGNSLEVYLNGTRYLFDPVQYTSTKTPIWVMRLAQDANGFRTDFSWSGDKLTRVEYGGQVGTKSQYMVALHYRTLAASAQPDFGTYGVDATTRELVDQLEVSARNPAGLWDVIAKHVLTYSRTGKFARIDGQDDDLPASRYFLQGIQSLDAKGAQTFSESFTYGVDVRASSDDALAMFYNDPSLPEIRGAYPSLGHMLSATAAYDIDADGIDDLEVLLPTQNTGGVFAVYLLSGSKARVLALPSQKVVLRLAS